MVQDSMSLEEEENVRLAMALSLSNDPAAAPVPKKEQ
jgi:hypothetical protein